MPNTRFFIPGSSWSGVHTSTGPEAPYDARDSGYHRRAPLSRQVGLEPIGSYDELVAHAETVSIGGRPTQVIGLDDLIPHQAAHQPAEGQGIAAPAGGHQAPARAGRAQVAVPPGPVTARE